MKIAIAADHRGFALKQAILNNYYYKDCQFIDFGTKGPEPANYPELIPPVCKAILDLQVDAGILLCGTAVGMSIGANRYQGILAATVFVPEIATKARQDENANVLVFPADFVDYQIVKASLDNWFDHKFVGGRHEARLAYLQKLPI
jgi:ribose 5-phosphate isomerase B